MSSPSHASSAPDFIRALREVASGRDAVPFATFMELALYHPTLGYYRRDRARVGRRPDADFFTATSLGPIFGELIVAAATTLLRAAGLDPAAHTWIEIGAEPDSHLLAEVAHPFAATRILRLGDTLEPSGPCVVFSNELFDAQPVHRLVLRAGAWRELGVTPDLAWTELPALSPPVAAVAETLPANAPEGYHLDLPLAANTLAAHLAAQPWTGLFLACDYGKSRDELFTATPQGTVRAYHRHRQETDLLARPGEQDLTAHPCWDDLTAAFAAHGFASPAVERQEAFFIHHAAAWLDATMRADAACFHPRKLALAQLLHPAHLGQKFQVLHALRPPPPTARDTPESTT